MNQDKKLRKNITLSLSLVERVQKKIADEGISFSGYIASLIRKDLKGK